MQAQDKKIRVVECIQAPTCALCLPNCRKTQEVTENVSY